MQGIDHKIPMLLRHPVTVNVAAGNYAGAYFTQRLWAPATSAGAYIAFVGPAFIAATPTTGSASGTATSAIDCNLNPIIEASVTDSGATWTTNDFQGLIIELTGGTNSGQFLPILRNTATTITLAGCWTGKPDATTTYTIRTWGAVINSAVNTPANYVSAAGTAVGLGFWGMQDSLRNTNSAAVFLDRIRVTCSSCLALQVSNSNVNTTRSRFDNSSGGPGVSVDGNSRIAINQGVVTSATGAAFSQAGLEGLQTTRVFNSLFRSGSTGSLPVAQISGPGVFMQNNSFLATSSSISNVMLVIPSTGGLSGGLNFQGAKVYCTAGGTSNGFFADNSANANPRIPAGHINLLVDSCYTSECSTGITVGGPSVVLNMDDTTFQATAGTTGISAYKGASVILDSNTVKAAGSTFTQELLIDTAPYTFANIATSNIVNLTNRTTVLSTP
jgi:hypothetical protein